MTTTMPFVCSICEEQSTRICVRCTKDTCGNHLCERCAACSDCCDCEVRLENTYEEEIHLAPVEASSGPRDSEPLPHPHPMPDPDPAPEPEPIPTFPVRPETD